MAAERESIIPFGVLPGRLLSETGVTVGIVFGIDRQGSIGTDARMATDPATTGGRGGRLC